METVYKISLALHILSGTGALLSGLLAMVFKKGGSTHRKSGKVFFFAMLSVCITAILISIMKDNRFLLSIGIFSFYQLFAGYRSVKNKTLKPAWYEWLFLLIGTVNATQMIWSGNLVLIIFGSLSGIQMIAELRLFLKTRKAEVAKNSWLKRHIGMMMGSYIATLTAFLVVNINHFEPAWLPWILPTIIFTPLIVYFTQKFTGAKIKKVAQ